MAQLMTLFNDKKSIFGGFEVGKTKTSSINIIDFTSHLYTIFVKRSLIISSSDTMLVSFLVVKLVSYSVRIHLLFFLLRSISIFLGGKIK